MISSQKLDKILGGRLTKLEEDQVVPMLSAKRISIVSRDYREAGGISDFNDCLVEVLSYCDKGECDTVLFSLFTILKTHLHDIKKTFENLKHIKTIFLEDFSFQNDIRCAGNYHCYYKENDKWHDYMVYQKFATVTHTREFEHEVIKPFIKEIATKRLLGSITVLLCGESNVVKYDKEKKAVVDQFGLLKVLPSEIRIILNPVHNRMTRFEMKLKRAFLSSNNRLVISVWNKGKTDKQGTNRDGKNPPWTIFSNGKDLYLPREPLRGLGFPGKDLDIGFVDVSALLEQK
jgi:hypothetical protein